ncbi:RecQ-mediated genome instability protein 2 [Heracleum sosnowskyi]|uniref:RecQ-mediated genome instability protein 2 n=1 Tax=Heracleum sosnowskyi TaxID=360622 RepID=A0AAD8HW43_9APIA|nr:RecQ-mediated genome instability protein 2 [Heracleum sosnowskyi]
MDYSLAALKVLCIQLKAARQADSQSGASLNGILFQRAWVQGVLVTSPTDDADGRFILDDGTGLIQLAMIGEFSKRKFESGMYLMVVGGFYVRQGDVPLIKVHKAVDLSAFPDREVMWYLEVLEAYKLFYQPIMGE